MRDHNVMILVVGGGVSAGYLAAAVAERGNGYALRIISDEDVLPYERPTLTKAALWKENPMRLPSFLTTVRSSPCTWRNVSASARSVVGFVNTQL